MALVLAGMLAGCLPPTSTPENEEREPFFRKGKELAKATDFVGATEAFEKALEINPHNALAHYELGLLCERDDQAAAMFHFAKFIKLRPKAPQAERANERLAACRQILAQNAAMSMTPNIMANQKELERLTIENRDLKAQLEQWKKWYVSSKTSTSPVTQPPPGVSVESVKPSPAPRTPPTPTPGTVTTNTKPITSLPPEPAPAPPIELQTHMVRSGETPASIARRYGVGVNALLEANPRVNPRRMRAGQILTIPPR